MIVDSDIRKAEEEFWHVIQEWSDEKNPKASESPGRKAFAGFLWEGGWFWSAGFSDGGPPARKPNVVKETADFVAQSRLQGFKIEPMVFAITSDETAYVFYPYEATYVDKETNKPTFYTGQVSHTWKVLNERLIISGGMTTAQVKNSNAS